MKKAKRVDVKRLKDNIWRELDLPTSEQEEEETAAAPESEVRPTRYQLAITVADPFPHATEQVLHGRHIGPTAILSLGQDGGDQHEFLLHMPPASGKRP